MIINQLRFSQIQVKLPTQKIICMLGATEKKDLEIQLDFQIGHSYDNTQRKVMGINGDQKGYIFQKQVFLLSQKQEDRLKIQLLCLTDQFKVYTKQVSLKKILQNAHQSLTFEVGQSQLKAQITCKFTHLQKTMSKRLIIINPKCQLLKIRMQRDRYLLQMNLMNSIQRTLIQTNTTFWQDSLRFYFNDQQSKHKIQIFLVDSKKNKNKIHELKIQIFKRKAGSKKIMVYNENNFPIGCFQFDYQTEGFSNIEKEVIPEIYSTEVYKINIGKLKGKFKSPTSSISILRVVSNIALINLEEIVVTENSFQYNLQKYIYSEGLNCMLIMTFIQDNVEVYGFAFLDLKMLGKFEKRVPIVHSQNKAIMGHLFINIQATKKHAKKLKLTDVCLKFENLSQKQRRKQVLVSASISCCFGKTQHRQLSNLVIFLQGFQIKYSKGQTLNLNLIETKTMTKMIIPIKLQQLQTKISGQYEQNFGEQLDLFKGTVSFTYNYDENGKDGMDQKFKLDTAIANKKEEAPINENSQPKKIEQNSIQINIENEKSENEKNAQVLIQQHKKQTQVQQHIKPKLLGDKHIQVIKKTPKQTLLQSLKNYNLQSNLIQQIRSRKKMKSHKKRVAVSSVQPKDSPIQYQGLPIKKSPNKIDSLQRYEYLKNIYLGMKNFTSSNPGSLHKKSYSSKRSELSCKKQKEVYKQPQLPIIANKRIKQGQRSFFLAIGNEQITRITVNKFRKQ